MRVLGVTSATRAELLPDVPTIGDFVSGYEVNAWLGIGAPTNTPPRSSICSTKRSIWPLADPKIRSRLIELGGSVLATSPAEFAKLIAEDAEKWRKVVVGGLKP